MNIVGKITRADMGLMQRRGLSPEQAVNAVRDETKRRYPNANAVLIKPSNLHDGFDIITM